MELWPGHIFGQIKADIGVCLFLSECRLQSEETLYRDVYCSGMGFPWARHSVSLWKECVEMNIEPTCDWTSTVWHWIEYTGHLQSLLCSQYIPEDVVKILQRPSIFWLLCLSLAGFSFIVNRYQVNFTLFYLFFSECEKVTHFTINHSTTKKSNLCVFHSLKQLYENPEI